jgi:hypothetical protein
MLRKHRLPHASNTPPKLLLHPWNSRLSFRGMPCLVYRLTNNTNNAKLVGVIPPLCRAWISPRHAPTTRTPPGSESHCARRVAEDPTITISSRRKSQDGQGLLINPGSTRPSAVKPGLLFQIEVWDRSRSAESLHLPAFCTAEHIFSAKAYLLQCRGWLPRCSGY